VRDVGHCRHRGVHFFLLVEESDAKPDCSPGVGPKIRMHQRGAVKARTNGYAIVPIQDGSHVGGAHPLDVAEEKRYATVVGRLGVESNSFQTGQTLVKATDQSHFSLANGRNACSLQEVEPEGEPDYSLI
jgi:hypothetical protein